MKNATMKNLLFQILFYNLIQLGPVYEGKKVFIDWKSGIGPAIFKQYQLPVKAKIDEIVHCAVTDVVWHPDPHKTIFFSPYCLHA